MYSAHVCEFSQPSFMHSDTRVMSCLSNCFTSSQNQKFFSFPRLPAGPSQLRENEAVGHQFLHHHQQQTCQDQNPHLVIWLLCIAGRRDSLLFISWADPSLGSTGEKYAFWLEVNWGTMTWSQRWIADLSLGCDFFFNRLTFGIWGKSQQFSGQSFHNCPLGRADMCLEAILLHWVSHALACAYKSSCFPRPGNVSSLFLVLLPCLLLVFLWPLTQWLGL